MVTTEISQVPLSGVLALLRSARYYVKKLKSTIALASVKYISIPESLKSDPTMTWNTFAHYKLASKVAGS